MSIPQTLIAALFLNTVVLAELPGNPKLPQSNNPTAIHATVAAGVPMQVPATREWYRTAVLFIGISAVSATFFHALSRKRRTAR